MTASTRWVWVTNTDQLTDLQRRLEAVAGRDWRNNLNRRIRRAAEPVKNDVQRTVRTLAIRGAGGRGRSGPTTNTRPLRATLAAAVRLSVTTGGGSRIWMDKGRLPPDLRSMPRNTDKGKWRHPTFGNRHRWVDQYAPANWWWDTIRPHYPRLQAEVARVLNDVERML